MEILRTDYRGKKELLTVEEYIQGECELTGGWCESGIEGRIRKASHFAEKSGVFLSRLMNKLIEKDIFNKEEIAEILDVDVENIK